MSWIRPAAIGAGAAIAGIGLATQTTKLSESLSAKMGEKYWDRQHSGEDKSATDYYGATSIFAAIGAIGLAVTGVTMLTTPGLAKHAIGAAALIGAGALGGATIGSFQGFATGKDASAEKHGTNIEEQADRLLRNFDHDKDGRLSTTDDAFPEYLHKYEVDFGRGAEPQVNWASIEKFLSAADADGDTTVDRDELVAKMGSYDSNGNGLLSSNDYQKFADDGLERVAIQSQIVELDHWGAVHTVPW